MFIQQISLVNTLFTERSKKTAATKVKVMPTAPAPSKSKQMKQTVSKYTSLLDMFGSIYSRLLAWCLVSPFYKVFLISFILS